MRKFFLIIIILISILKINAQQITISDSATISLITCSPGQEVYSIFGHTAIRVKDATTGVDIVFNYGIFSFETENFYYKFIKGETDYQLGVYNTSIFLPEYAERKSMVWEQVLNLTPTEKRRIITALENNYKPENRIYRYNFAYDNCSTRPRDKITSAMFGFIKFPTVSDSKTFRQWIGVYTGSDTWLKFGIDIIFGLEADKTTTTNESMFLPEVLMTEFQSAQVSTLNGPSKKLVSQTNILVDNNQPDIIVTPWYFRPITFSMILLIAGAIITLWDNKRKRLYKPFDTAIFILTGLAGLVIFYLMMFSSHPLVKYNLNLLWLNPLNLIVAVILWIRPLRAYLFAYEFLNIGLLVGSLFAFALSAQTFNVAAFPLIVLLLMRATSWFAYTKKRLYKHKEKMKR